jgi:hypothetical protein
MHPTLFVNSDAFVNTACLRTHVSLECSWYDSYQHWWCVRFERSAALLSVDPSSPVYAILTLTFVFTNTHGPVPLCSIMFYSVFTLTFVFTNTHGPRYAKYGVAAGPAPFSTYAGSGDNWWPRIGKADWGRVGDGHCHTKETRSGSAPIMYVFLFVCFFFVCLFFCLPVTPLDMPISFTGTATGTPDRWVRRFAPTR